MTPKTALSEVMPMRRWLLALMLLLLPAVCFVVHSFQSRPTQGDKMPLQHRRIFNRHALFVHFE